MGFAQAPCKGRSELDWIAFDCSLLSCCSCFWWPFDGPGDPNGMPDAAAHDGVWLHAAPGRRDPEGSPPRPTCSMRSTRMTCLSTKLTEYDPSATDCPLQTISNSRFPCNLPILVRRPRYGLMATRLLELQPHSNLYMIGRVGEKPLCRGPIDLMPRMWWQKLEARSRNQNEAKTTAVATTAQLLLTKNKASLPQKSN